MLRAGYQASQAQNTEFYGNATHRRAYKFGKTTEFTLPKIFQAFLNFFLSGTTETELNSIRISINKPIINDSQHSQHCEANFLQRNDKHFYL